MEEHNPSVDPLGSPNTCREIRPANVYDVAANETWLEDMAAQGWRLTGMTAWSGVFEKAEPAACRYRMQPVPKKQLVRPVEMVELYGSLGWEYVCTLQGLFYVWRSDDSDVPELDTDPVVQGIGYRYLKRRMLWDGVCSLLLVAVLWAAWALIPWMFGETPVLDTVTEWVPGRLLVGTVGAALILVLLFCEVRAMVRLLRTLGAGIPLKRPRPYRLQRWLARGLLVCFVFILAAPFLGDLRNMSGSSLARGWDAKDGPAPQEGAVYVDLADLEGAETTDFWRCRTKVQELCPRMYVTWQRSLGPAEEDLQPGDSLPVISTAETTYYRMLTEGLAAQLAEELVLMRPSSFGSSGFVQGHPALAPVETDGLDGFWWGENTYYQFALVRQGREVLFLQYEGNTDLRQQGDYFAALLAK